jgi:hypothetical protein
MVVLPSIHFQVVATSLLWQLMIPLAKEAEILKQL